MRDLVRREPGSVGGNDEAPNARIRLGPDDGDIGDVAAGDPHLRAVDDPVVPVSNRVGSHRAGIGAGVGFGQSKAAEDLAGSHSRQPALLLLLRAERPDGKHAERALHRHEAAGSAVSGLQLGARQAVADRVGAGATVPVEVHPKQTEGPHLLGELLREEPGLEPFVDVGKNAVANELSNRVANEPLFVGEQAVDLQEIPGIRRPRFDRVGHGGKPTPGPILARDRRRQPGSDRFPTRASVVGMRSRCRSPSTRGRPPW